MRGASSSIWVWADADTVTVDVVTSGQSTERIAALCWSEVDSIEVYKRDLWVVDLICMVLRTADGRSLELHEEMEGWDRLLADLPTWLPGCKSRAEWWHAVAVPEFELNCHRVFQRGEGL